MPRARSAGPIRRPTTPSAVRTPSCCSSWRRCAERLNRSPLLATPDASPNQAFGWAVRRDPSGVRADPGPGLLEWDVAEFAELLDRARDFRRAGPAAMGAAPYFLPDGG